MNKFVANKSCCSIIDYMWKVEMKHYLENIHQYTEHLSEQQVDILRDELIRFKPIIFDQSSANLIKSLMLPSGEHILEDVFQLAMFRKEELLDAPLFDEMSCSEENSLQNESDYQDGLLSKTITGAEKYCAIAGDPASTTAIAATKYFFKNTVKHEI